MSKIGKKPVTIPESVTITVADSQILVKGSKGELTIPVNRLVDVKVEENQALVTRKNDSKQAKAVHGTTRSIIQNAIIGVTKGYSKTLKLVGTGYRVAQQGKDINISLGFSHPVIINAIDGIDYKLEGQDTIIISGINKQLVGQVAANIRSKKPPEPYKGKGIRYLDEYVVRKAGKAAKSE